MSHTNSLARILDANRLTGSNFVDWLRNLRIVLKFEKMGYVLERSVLESLPEGSNEEEKSTYEKWQDDDLKARSYMLASMSNELQKQHENYKDAAGMILHLRELYGEQSRTARYEISKELFRTRMAEGANVQEHVLKMINLIERLEDLDFNMDITLQTDLVLQSLPDSYSQFIVNFHMNKIECTLAELLNMLNVANGNMKGKTQERVLVVSSSNKKKNNKKASTSGPSKKISKKKSKDKPAVDKGKCFFCQKDGHWKRNCSEHLKFLKGKGKETPSEDH